MPALYSDVLRDFLEIHPEQLLGKLTSGLANEGFDTTATTTFSWQSQIVDLAAAMRTLVSLLPKALNWPILFEYVFPIIRQRLDCVLLADDTIYVIEYKDGNSTTARAALRQAQDYALNLSDFHEASRSRIVIPIAVGTFRMSIPLNLESHSRGAAVVPSDLPEVIRKALSCGEIRAHR